MPLRYIRDDADLAIRTCGDDLKFELRVGDAVHPFKTAATLLGSEPALVSALMGWTALLGPVNRRGTSVMLPRLVIHAHQPGVAAVAWEDVLSRLRLPAAVPPELVVMRGTDVLARSLSRQFDFPARVLEIGAPARVSATAQKLLGRTPKEYALVVRQTALLAADRAVASLRWPSVDILHVHTVATRDASRRAKPADPGGLEWLFRLADRWHVRLVVIEALATDAGTLRQAAQRQVDRGGPAIFVLASSRANTIKLYESLLHDRPLDWCQQKLSNATLFAGGGRSEAVRFSQIGLGLTSRPARRALQQWIARNTKSPEKAIVHVPLKSAVVSRVVREVGEDLGLKRRNYIALTTDPQRLIRFNDIVSTRLMDYGYALYGFQPRLRRHYPGTVHISSLASSIMRTAVPLPAAPRGKRRVMLEPLVMSRLTNLERLMDVAVFEDHESDATLPLATTTTELRKLIQMSTSKREKPAKPVPRHVIVEFYSWSESGPPRRIPQASARLTPGVTVHLGVLIGARSPATFAIGELIFADAAIDWEKEKQGVWLEVGVTGIDVDVLGDPVQPVWLPAIGNTTVATFAVRPRSQTQVHGVARVRVTLFYRNNVVQSFLMAAALTTSDGNVTAALAAALSVEPTAVRDGVGYVARQEYSALDPNAVPALSDRTLSIVANESAGQKIFTIKGEDFFSTTVNANVRNPVNALRAALTAASHGKLADEYGYDDHDNSGKATALFEALWNLASSGWELWSLLVPSVDRQEEIRQLLGDGGVVTAAHVDLTEVVPWSLVYDREVSTATQYSPDWTAPLPVIYEVERALCPAALPAADGSMPTVVCGAAPKCLLHKNALAARQAQGKTMLPESVICPRHFWGFMHQIEVPVQQTPKEPKSPRVPAVQPVVQAVAPVRLVAGFNDHVCLAAENRTRLEKVTADAKATLTEATKATAPRDAFLQTLKQLDPDLVYLYCHAWPETLQEKSVPHPNLDFGTRLLNEIAFANNFSGPAWQHRPLVFLNGCGTVGFTPLAPAEFITQFIQGRHASAVIGTEVTVWAQLAHEVGWKFCEGFLAGQEAGAILLTIRRQLLQKNNPLGLVYTLYGSAGLRLVTAASKPSLST